MDALVEGLDVDFDTVTTPPWGPAGRVAVLTGIAGVCKFALNVMNTTNVSEEERGRFVRAVTEREPGVPLLTVGNHRSTVDDPGLFATLLPLSVFYKESDKQWNRWTLCAKEICYMTDFWASFFRCGKALPVIRGGGLNQPAMGVAGKLLGYGDWVHIFPEGRISFSGNIATPFKKGAGRLVCDSARLPFYHTGIEGVMPKFGRFPRVGNTVNINVGEPIDMADLCDKCRRAGGKEKELKKVYALITARIQARMEDMERAHHEQFGTVGVNFDVVRKPKAPDAS